MFLLLRSRKMKIMLKRIIVDNCAYLWKNVSHLKKLKKTTTTKNKPKIVQNTMTNSCPQSHDDWRFMALWLTGGKTFKKDQVERVGKHGKPEQETRDLNGVGWSVVEAITLSAQSRWNEYCILYKWRFILQSISQFVKTLSVVFLQCRVDSLARENKTCF